MRNLERYLAIEIVAINAHKWILSERAGHDVGDYTAFIDWTDQRDCGLSYADRFREIYHSNEEQFEKMCQSNCQGQCHGIGKCPFDRMYLHSLLDRVDKAA